MKRRCVYTETYNEIYERMRAKYAEETGTEIDSASDIAIRLRVLAGEIYNMQTNFEWLKRQLFAATADGEFLERLAEQRGLERRAAVKAQGMLEFRLKEVKNMPVIIPAGTSVATYTDTPVLIYTTQDSQIPPNTYAVKVPAEAEQAGYSGNINVRTAEVPVNVPPEIDTVTNLSVFEGGADAESDASLRERIRKSYLNQPNGMNQEYYIKLAKSVDGVHKAGVVPKVRGLGTLNVYVCGYDRVVDNETLGKVQKLMDSERGLNVSVNVNNAYAFIYDLDVKVIPKTGYENEEVIEKITSAFEEFIYNLDLGSRLYISALGKHLMETGCIENYEFGYTMQTTSISGNQYFVPGDISVEVTDI